jgi:epoxyqueuosine reductase QueG
VPAQKPEVRADQDESAFWPREGVHGAKLVELMGLSQEEFSRRFENSPVKRAK